MSLSTHPLAFSDNRKQLKRTFIDLFYQETSIEYQNAIELARKRVSLFLKDTKKPFSGIRPNEIKQKIASIDLEKPLHNYNELLDEVNEIYIKHATAFHLPEYIAHLNCPVVIPALCADVIISAINSSQDTYDQSAGGTYIERRLIDWTANLIGYDNTSDGIFTAGGSQSNLMGLILARDFQAKNKLGINMRETGVNEQVQKFRFFISEQAHYSNIKNAAILGLGETAIVKVPTDNCFRMDFHALEVSIQNAIEEGNIPVAIVATAGTTDFGNIDPIESIATIVKKYDLWLHVDAAYGCGLLMSDNYKHLLNGIELADSVTIDYHKSFFQPVSSSALIVKDKMYLELMRFHAEYLNPADQDYEELPAQVNKSATQITRRFEALKLWFTLRYMGRELLGLYTDMTIATAAETAEILLDDPDFQLLCPSDISALVFRFVKTGISDAMLNSVNKKIKYGLFYSGEIMVASTKINGIYYLKFTILNPLTTIENIKSILTKIKEYGNKSLINA